MRGTVGYLGKRTAFSIVIDGLRRLEYRGYDSADFILNATIFHTEKTKDKVSGLVAKARTDVPAYGSGMGHTRWVTHGVPNDVNSHPHLSNLGRIAIVHNDIIENYANIKQNLIKEGFTFHSDTDIEVLVNFIKYFKQKEQKDLATAVRCALSEVVGVFAIAVTEEGNPREIAVARLESPLAIGVGSDEFFIASNASPFIEYTQNAVHSKDGEMATIRLNEPLEVIKIGSNEAVSPFIQQLKLNLGAIEKGGYDHFMLKEIYEQLESIQDTMRGRLLPNHTTRLSGIEAYLESFLNAKRIIIVACGTSWHAGLVGKYLLGEYARIPVKVEYASEFRHRNPIINKDDIVIAISQSGETADTLAALKLVKEKGAFIYGICNVVGSSIARITDSGTYTHAGPEIEVASTKVPTIQLTVLILIALYLGHKKGTISDETYQCLCEDLGRVPSLLEITLNKIHDNVKAMAKNYKHATNCLYLGHGFNFPTTLEGALRLKEISYIHAEGYFAAEMKHGPIALIDENMPVIFIVPNKGHYDKVVSNAQEIETRKGKIIAVVTEGDTQMAGLANHVIEVPEISEALTPILASVPL